MKAEVHHIGVLAVSILTALVSLAHADESARANVGLLIDTSASLSDHSERIAASARRMLKDIEEAPHKRWEKPSVHVSVIVLDSVPSVVWSGSSADLRTLNPEDLIARLRARSGLGQCTDVLAGLRLALREVGPADSNVARYVLVYSDLRHEPPVPPREGRRGCAHAVPVPDNVPWNELQGVEFHALFLPEDQYRAWTHAAGEASLDSFHAYTQAESAVVSLKVPAPPTGSAEAVEAKRSAVRAEATAAVASAGRTFLSVAAWAGGVLVASLVFGAAVGRAHKRRTQRRAAPSGGRTLNAGRRD